uniref:E2F transcription factor 3 n=1 Tax=Pavo cristatus TaxID=9049 RepID=A0A8C9FUP2_PAVCR
MMAQRQGLTKEVTELTQEEKKLDELIQSCTLDLKLLTEDSENQRYPFCQNLSKDHHPTLCSPTLVLPIFLLSTYSITISIPSCYLCPEVSLFCSCSLYLKCLASVNSGQGDCSVNMATISPLASPANLLQQTEDQIPSNFEGPFVNLLPPLLQEDYLLSLGDEEGISDLFDAYDLEKLPSLVDEFIYS